jgi:hypothetical protein
MIDLYQRLIPQMAYHITARNITLGIASRTRGDLRRSQASCRGSYGRRPAGGSTAPSGQLDLRPTPQGEERPESYDMLGNSCYDLRLLSRKIWTGYDSAISKVRPVLGRQGIPSSTDRAARVCVCGTLILFGARECQSSSSAKDALHESRRRLIPIVITPLCQRRNRESQGSIAQFSGA